MTHEEFRKLVADMRHVQKSYFRTRRSDDLEESKHLERKVDEALTDNGQKELELRS